MRSNGRNPWPRYLLHTLLPASLTMLANPHLYAVYAATTIAILLVGFSGPAYTASQGLDVSAGPPHPGHGTTLTLTLGSPVGTHLNAPFYGIVFADYGLGPGSAASLGKFFNSTPITVFRLGGALDQYDPTTGTEYVAPSGAGQYVATANPLINFTWFESWCDSRTPHCQWIGSLPAEENNTTAAVHFATWYHDVLGFAPTYWELGNEPDAWSHYGKNLSTWSTTDDSTPTGPAYAAMVHSYISAIRAVFPKDQFIGIQDNCACNPPLVTDTAALNGPNLTAMAYHSYPWANASSTDLPQFYGALQSARNISTTAAHMRALDSANCPSCANLPVELGEYNAGPVPVHSPFATQYPGAPFMAASVIQAIDANVSMFTAFSLGWLYNSSSTVVQPMGVLYQQILANLTMGTDYSVNVKVGTVGGVYALLVKNGSRDALLIVNTNSTHTLTTTLNSLLFPVGALGSEWRWIANQPFPSVTRNTLLPMSYTIGEQGILLLTNY
jgi:hypothetical protein